MAVQIPDPGTGNGQTGDNEYVFRKKVRDNFSDQNNAASRLVGTTSESVVLGKSVYRMYGNTVDGYKPRDSGFDVNNIPQGEIWLVSGYGNINTPPEDAATTDWLVETRRSYSSNTVLQIAWGYNTPVLYMRTYWKESVGWSNWQSAATDVVTYSTTTAAGANVVVDSTGKLMRSTSSERYKNIIAPLELDDEAYANAMHLAPIVYRSTAEADNPDYHYYSFSAEVLGAYDPAFTLWRETETVTDDAGNVTEQPLTERVAEGININALLAFSHAIAIKQDKMIKAQAEAIEALTKRIDAMTAQ